MTPFSPVVFNAGSEKSAAQLDSLTEDVLRCDAAHISLTAPCVSFFYSRTKKNNTTDL